MKHLTYTVKLVLPLLYCSLISCSSTEVIVEKDLYGKFHLNNYESFGFFGIDSEESANPEFAQTVAILKEEITSQMQKRGLIHDQTNPDLNINLGVTVADKVQTRETNLVSDPFLYIGQRNYTWKVREVPVNTYKEGSLTIHLVESGSNEAVWVGTANKIIPKKEAKRHEAISTVVEDIFQKLDPNT